MQVRNLSQRYRYSIILLKQLVKTDFKLRYQNSVLGYIWSLLRPLLLFIILYFVFTKFLKVGKDIPYYPVYLLVGIVLWNYFVEVTSGSVGAIVGRGDLMRKINFPKYVIILAGSASALINLLLNSIVIAVFMVISQIPLTYHVLLVIPLIIELFIAALGVAFLLSALYVRFRDISYIWEVVTQAAFYATPILYPLSLVSPRIAKVMLLNPIAQIIQDIRYCLVTTETQTIGYLYGGNKAMWLIPISLTMVTATVAGLYFRARSKYFAEEV
jgi:ABC-2 type transport system permease protein